VGAGLILLESGEARAAAAIVLVLASATDWLDGYLARRWQQISAVGTAIDPIADKLLMVAVLVPLVSIGAITGVHVVAVLGLLLREIWVPGIREALAGRAVKLPVTKLAKWKTAAQMAAVVVLTVDPAWLFGSTSGFGAMLDIVLGTLGLGLLWLAMALTLWTGWQYTVRAIASLRGETV
jgi:cardiolipin synthase